MAIDLTTEYGAQLTLTLRSGEIVSRAPYFVEITDNGSTLVVLEDTQDGRTVNRSIKLCDIVAVAYIC